VGALVSPRPKRGRTDAERYLRELLGPRERAAGQSHERVMWVVAGLEAIITRAARE
jgi:hypothetical protein